MTVFGENMYKALQSKFLTVRYVNVSKINW